MTAPVPGSLARRVTVGALWMVAVRFSSRTLGLISTLVVARILLPADFGLVAMAIAFSQSVTAFSEVGVGEALVRHPQDATSLYDTAFTMQVIRGFLTAAVVALAAPFAGSWLGEPRLGPIFLVLAALAAVSGFENIAIAEFRRNLRFDVEFALQILPRVLQVAVAIAAALLLHSYWALLIAISVSKLSRLVATYAVHPHRPRFTLRGWRELFGFSFWTWASSLAGIAWTRSEAFIITPALGVAAFGLYSLAWEIGVLPSSEFFAPAIAALFPGFAEARRRGDTETLSPMAVVAFLTMLAVPLAIAVSAAGGPLVTVLLGQRWLAARPLVAITAIYCVVSPFSFIAGTLLSASGKVARFFVVTFVSALVRIAALAYAVRGGDLLVVTWVAVGTIAVEGLVFAAVLRAAGELRLRPHAWALARTLAAGLVSLAVTWSTGWGWHDAASQRVLPAILDGTRVGLLAIAVFSVAVGILWRLAGSPYGPEARALNLLRPLVARITRRAHTA